MSAAAPSRVVIYLEIHLRPVLISQSCRGSAQRPLEVTCYSHCLSVPRRLSASSRKSLGWTFAALSCHCCISWVN